MKIRTDFVTNSSSSNFSLVIAIETKDGTTYSFEEDPYDYSPDEGGSCRFAPNLKDLLINHAEGNQEADQVLSVADVKELAQFLMNGVMDDYKLDDDWEGEEEEEEFEEIDDDMGDDWEEDDFEKDDFGEDDFEEVIAARKARFISDVSDHISSVNDIAKISVHRDYSAWGEYAELVADNDQVLCELAEKVNNSSGEEQEQALDEMLAYIRQPSADRCVESFGEGYDDFRYAWDGDKEGLMRLAKRLCSNRGPRSCSGREHDEIDLIKGTAESYAEFDLC